MDKKFGDNLLLTCVAIWIAFCLYNIAWENGYKRAAIDLCNNNVEITYLPNGNIYITSPKLNSEIHLSEEEKSLKEE